MFGRGSIHNQVHGYARQLRIGVSSGPLTTGVIGVRTFIYDMSGDTVNEAVRMESTALPGRIQVTESVAESPGLAFSFEDRGPVQVKGKDGMVTYLVANLPAEDQDQVHSKSSHRRRLDCRFNSDPAGTGYPVRPRHRTSRVRYAAGIVGNRHRDHHEDILLWPIGSEFQ